MLAIEKGKHVIPMIPADQRYCKVCNIDTFEDEEHFLCNCSKYDVLHKQFYDIRNIFNVKSNYFIIIMSYGTVSGDSFEKNVYDEHI